LKFVDTAAHYSSLQFLGSVREAASALAFLHGVGVVHCDLKPEVRLDLVIYFCGADL